MLNVMKQVSKHIVMLVSSVRLEERTEKLEEVKRLIKIRVEGGGYDKTPMVEHEGTKKRAKLKGELRIWKLFYQEIIVDSLKMELVSEIEVVCCSVHCHVISYSGFYISLE